MNGKTDDNTTKIDAVNENEGPSIAATAAPAALGSSDTQPAVNSAAAAVAAPRAKINISLTKKKKSKSSTTTTSSSAAAAALAAIQKNNKSLLGEEYSTIAEEAEVISQRRKEEGTILVIPCQQGTQEEGGTSGKRTQPLLAARLNLLRGGSTAPRDGVDGHDDIDVAIDSKEGSENAPSKEKEKEHAKNTKQNQTETITMPSSDSTNKDLKNEAENDATSRDKPKASSQEDDAVLQLIQSAQQSQHEKNNNNDDYAGGGGGRTNNQLIIAAPSKNKLITSHDNKNTATTTNTTNPSRAASTTTTTMIMNEEEQFKQELAHHAPDVDPTSHVYASVSIRDFGSALLRGMGWTGGGSGGGTSSNTQGSNRDLGNEVKPRPHRLGLGAVPLPPPSSKNGSGGGAGGGIHRRIRRPEEVRRDEERQRAQEEAEKKAKEKKHLDTQFTLQKGSIVFVRDEDGVDNIGDYGDRHSNNGRANHRAVVVQTAGVPGLNRILIKMEGSSKEVSVTKRSVVLCSWEELERNPFQKVSERSAKSESSQERFGNGRENNGDAGGNSSSARAKQSQSFSDDDNGYASRDGNRERDDRRRRDRRSDSRERSGDRDSSRHRRKKRSRSRSRSRDRSSERRRDSSRRRDRSPDRNRDRDRKRDRRDRDRHNDRHHRDRSRSEDGHKKRSKSHHHSSSSHNQTERQQHHIHWLLPNIRVRLISKKIPKYYLQKGVVQDVIQNQRSSSHSGHHQQQLSPKAVLLMDNGQVLDNIPERYLETALPKAGGNVIVLEGIHHWKKGRLLERSSGGGYGVVQLTEDLEVVKVSLDSIAEWCGPLDDDDFE